MFLHQKNNAEPYCQCFNTRLPKPWKQLSACSCGEELGIQEWSWEQPTLGDVRSALVSEDGNQVTFHPYYSSGTAVVRGDTPLQLNCHHYWEVKMLTDAYGTDIMIGVGTSKVNTADSQYKFTSLLGEDRESYGLSYTGLLRHEGRAMQSEAGFCKGSLVGVRLDLWHGTLEFYLNRKPQGECFFNLRRHSQLFPMLCSTAAQSSMRLTYATSWQASLLVDAARILAQGARRAGVRSLPPGLQRIMQNQFWITLPTEESAADKAKPTPMGVTKSILTEMFPSLYMNGFYEDSIAPDHRLVVWEST